MANEASRIVLEIRDGVARITLNQPPLNIIDIPMMQQMLDALSEVGSAAGVKVLVIDHSGRAFSAGVSIQDHTPEKVGLMLEKFHGVFRLLDSLSAPSLALVDGMALGGGCELAVFCDLVLASDRASFGQPEIKVGVFPPVAAVLFPHLIGRNKALELLLTGEVIDAAEARAIGLINRVFPAASFREKAEEFVRKLTSLSGPVLKLTRRAVDTALYKSMGDGLTTVEHLYLQELMKTEDAQEGLNAFLQKRQPIWKDK
jgi:cyclohexa-1,5-dienecarbonyl-CoA hydratase